MLDNSDIIDVHNIIVLGKGITRDFMNTIKQYVEDIPAPTIYKKIQ